jgi:hypothetical protein
MVNLFLFMGLLVLYILNPAVVREADLAPAKDKIFRYIKNKTP